jgi:tyrosinase
MTFSVVLNSNGTELGKVENVVINLCPRGENYVLSPDEGACQKCTCNNGNGKVVCSEAVRTRKNLKDVSKEEFAKYASLVNKLKEGASKKEGIWADYEWIHRAADVHNIPTNGTDKVTIRPFFHWHRRFIYELETELIRLYYEETGSCDIAIPYFDSVSEEPRTSFVWSEDYFGSTNDGSTQNGDCEVTEVTNAGFSIPNGPFRHSGGCSGVILTRKWKTFEMAFETTKAYKSHLLDGEQNPLKWMENLGDLHVKVHAEVGGTMRNNAWSPRDPIFFSHHAYIDKLWADQQAQGGEWSTVEYATENKLRNLRVRNENGEKSVLWEDFYTLEDVQDTKMLKYKRGDPNWGVKYEETPQRMLAANKRPKWMKESGELEPFMQKHVEYMKRELKKLREEMMSIDSLEE